MNFRNGLIVSLRLIFILFFTLLGTITEAQVVKIAEFNFNDISGMPDSVKPWLRDKGVRSVAFAGDINNNGLIELAATDYSLGGRVHLLELNRDLNKLEIIWSSPSREAVAPNSTPRWVCVGDLDGDSLKEIIFPLSNNAADLEVQVWEYTGSGNDFGTVPALVLPANHFQSISVGPFRTNREVAEVSDFDDDGRDELIMTNRDHNVYILGVTGLFPGSGTWSIEGGHPNIHPWNSSKFSISNWHSIPVNVSGNQKIIVNHHWNYFSFWSIIPIGNNLYRYPESNAQNYYVEFTKNASGDQVAYMGIRKADVDGDGQDEIGGILYGGSSRNYSLSLIDFTKSDTGLSIWNNSKYGIISSKAWELAGFNTGTFWGIGAGDFNCNGREELLMGGDNNKYEVVGVEYKGSGGLLDSSSYNKYIFYADPDGIYKNFEIRDSAGIKDTIKSIPSYNSRFSDWFDSDNDGRKEVAVSYQQIPDTLQYKFYSYNFTSNNYVLDSTVLVNNPRKVNIKILEWQGTPTNNIKLIYPDGGEILNTRSECEIKWNSLGVDSVNIDYSTNYGKNWIRVVSGYISNNGSYTWEIPNTISTTCKVKISHSFYAIINDISNGTFTINKPGPNWMPTQNLQYNMSVIAKVKIDTTLNIFSTNPKDKLGAFIVAGSDTQCRGVSSPTLNGLYIMNIVSENITGDSILFKYYNYEKDSIENLTALLPFNNSTQIGTLTSPYIFNNNLTSADKGNDIPTEYLLEQNFPNPFNPTTIIKYQLPTSGFVSLKVYDMLGNEVTNLVDEEKIAGKYSVTFDARRLSSGVYFYKLRVKNFIVTKKMLLIK